MLYSDFCDFLIIYIQEIMRLGLCECRFSFCIVFHNCGYISVQRTLYSIQVCNRCICCIFPTIQPVNNLISDCLITWFFIQCCCILKCLEFLDQIIHICFCDRFRFQFIFKCVEFFLQFYWLLKLSYTAVHILIDHMLGQLSECITCFCLYCRIMIYKWKCVFPCLICIGICIPDIPCIGCICKNSYFTWLWLLHRVQHDSLNLRRINTTMKECAVTTHDQMLMWVIWTRPVDPHERTSSYIICKCSSKIICNLTPDTSTGHNDLYIFRYTLQGLKFTGTSISHIIIRNERKCHLHIRVFLLHLCQPGTHIVQKSYFICCSRIYKVIRKNRNLTYSCINYLLKLCFQFCKIFIIVCICIKAEVISTRKWMQGIHKSALGSISSFCKWSDLTL